MTITEIRTVLLSLGHVMRQEEVENCLLWQTQKKRKIDKDVKEVYVGPPYCRVEMYAGRVACCPWWVTASIPSGLTDGRTPDRYITLSVITHACIATVSVRTEINRKFKNEKCKWTITGLYALCIQEEGTEGERWREQRDRCSGTDVQDKTGQLSSSLTLLRLYSRVSRSHSITAVHSHIWQISRSYNMLLLKTTVFTQVGLRLPFLQTLWCRLIHTVK